MVTWHTRHSHSAPTTTTCARTAARFATCVRGGGGARVLPAMTAAKVGVDNCSFICVSRKGPSNFYFFRQSVYDCWKYIWAKPRHGTSCNSGVLFQFGAGVTRPNCTSCCEQRSAGLKGGALPDGQRLCKRPNGPYRTSRAAATAAVAAAASLISC